MGARARTRRGVRRRLGRLSREAAVHRFQIRHPRAASQGGRSRDAGPPAARRPSRLAARGVRAGWRAQRRGPDPGRAVHADRFRRWSPQCPFPLYCPWSLVRLTRERSALGCLSDVKVRGLRAAHRVARRRGCGMVPGRGVLWWSHSSLSFGAPGVAVPLSDRGVRSSAAPSLLVCC